MKIHEYQAKDLLKKYNVPVLFNQVVFSAYDAGKVGFDEFEAKGHKLVVIKAQVHAGGSRQRNYF